MEEWLTFPAVKDVVLFALAIYGAGLSTFNWRQAVRKERRSVMVKFSTEIPAFNTGTGPAFVKVEAVNTGHRSVVITALTIELTGGGRLFSLSDNYIPGMPITPLPATLSDGQSAHSLFMYREIAEALVESGRAEITEITPLCEDSVGGIYRGDPWTVNPEEFSRM